MRIEVVYSPAERQVECVCVQLSEGATVLHALRESRLLEKYPGIDLTTGRVGVWGRMATLSQPLREGDRVELYRPLKVDPKEARRLRYRGQRGKKQP